MRARPSGRLARATSGYQFTKVRDTSFSGSLSPSDHAAARLRKARKDVGMPISNYAPLDEALKRLSGYDIELKNGNSNHAPMVAEALCAMGRSEAVMPWIARYRDRLLPLRPPGARSHIGSWGSTLGKRDRFADWAEFFAQELQRAPWREVLDRWVARLAPGFSSAATHGSFALATPYAAFRSPSRHVGYANSATPLRAGRPPIENFRPAIAPAVNQWLRARRSSRLR